MATVTDYVLGQIENQKNRDNFLNTEGSVNVFGTGGKLRHSAVLSEDNPVRQQLLAATNNQDKDALYERAINWELDNARYLQELETNRAILEEQRAYDLPSAEIARQRDAGINPDIAGSGSGTGSGSGSASMAVPDMDNTPGQTKFSNSYDNTAMVLQGFQTAASVVSSIAGFVGTITDAKVKLDTLPANVRLAEASADVAERTADSVVATAQASARSAELSNMRSSLDLMGYINEYTTPDSTDDDIKQTFTTLGIPEEQHANYLKSLRHFQSNPRFQADWQAGQLAARQATARNSTYTTEVVGRMVSVGQQIEEMSLTSDADMAAIKSSITSYMRASDFAQNQAQATVEGSALSLEETKFARKRLEHDVKVFAQNIANQAIALRKSRELCDKIHADAAARPRFNVLGSSFNNDQYTPAERAILEAEETRQKAIAALGSTQLPSLYTLMRQTAKLDYDRSFRAPYGVELPLVGKKRYEQFSDVVFMDYVNSSSSADDIGKKIVSTALGYIPYVGSIASNIVNAE